MCQLCQGENRQSFPNRGAEDRQEGRQGADRGCPEGREEG